MKYVFPVLVAWSATASAAPPVDFNRDVKPILSDKCFACHGFDAKARKGKLRLDTAEGAYAERDDHPAITPGDIKKSALWERVNTTDAEVVMPPPHANKTLSAAEKELLRKWIEQGATYRK